jgi:hypothetical protein
MNGLKDLVRPPFANYDVVVYFGGGLFIIPFLNRYILQPLQLSWPQFQISLKSEIASEIVSALVLLFTIYILGHILAYTSSQFVEKLTDRLLGKISTSILVSSWVRPKKRNELIRALIYDRFMAIKGDNAIFPTLVRSLAHLPVVPTYIGVYSLGIFGYYNTRVPYSIILAARRKLPTIGLGNIGLGIRTKWFKPIEYYVMNRSPSATARMYNYLVIGGLFRTLCVVFLFSLWAQLYYAIHYWRDGDWFIQPIMNSHKPYTAIVEYALISAAYIFSLFSYLKFQRRYAEEAIFAFVFEQAPPPGSA